MSYIDLADYSKRWIFKHKDLPVSAEDLEAIRPMTPERSLQLWQSQISAHSSDHSFFQKDDWAGNSKSWLETDNWRLTSNGQALSIMGTDYWEQQWDEIDLPQAYRSTFFWTQLPAVVDLQADEPVGGNIVVPGSVKHFDIEANFMTDQDKSGKPIQIRFDQVECPKEAPSP